MFFHSIFEKIYTVYIRETVICISRSRDGGGARIKRKHFLSFVISLFRRLFSTCLCKERAKCSGNRTPGVAPCECVMRCWLGPCFPPFHTSYSQCRLCSFSLLFVFFFSSSSRPMPPGPLWRAPASIIRVNWVIFVPAAASHGPGAQFLKGREGGEGANARPLNQLW